jgi:methionyl aminopeptidase
VKLLGDGWTVVTKDHSLSAQWSTPCCTADGYEVLTPAPPTRRGLSVRSIRR